MAKPFVVWFDQVDKEDIPLVGGKGANLGEMTQAKIPVPQGFIVTAPAYYHFIKENNLAHKISETLKLLNYNDPHSLNQTSLAVKKIILDAHLPKDLATIILKDYHQLNSHAQNFEKKVFKRNGTALKQVSSMLDEPLVAVRSSATAEDLPTASFAGQQATFLNVHGDVELLQKIKECYASLFEARAIFYREENKFDHFKIGIAVPVQKMVQSVNSGVMFTIDPITNAKTKITIEAVYGLGEMIVQGAVNPDHYEVDKKDLTILTKQISKQQVMLSQEGRITKERKVPAADVGKQKISDELIVEIAKIGRQLEHHYFFPQDIEWAVEDGKVYIVQTRPITTIHEAEEKVELTPQDKKEVETLMKHVALKGDPASPGLRSGPVKVVLKPSEIDKVKPGDILIAPQTNPDYVPAMKKASAIVTERGGRTSHAAIVSRELGIPAVVGALGATKKFDNGTIITVNGTTGEVYKGGLPKGAQIELNITETDTVKYPHANAQTATKIYVNLAEPDRAADIAKRHVEGVGLLRAEFILAQIGTHPRKFIKDGRQDVFSNTLAENLRTFCESFNPRPVVYRLSDFKTNEYRNLKGGAEFEPHEENPMIGFRGAYRFIKDPDTLKLEVNAIKKVRNTFGLKNLHVMVPYVRTVDELEHVKKLMTGFGLSRSPSFKLWMMVEIPSNVILLEEFIKVGIDGVSIGSNDLTQLTLGTDRDNSELATTFNENNPAVLNSIEHIIKTCHKMGITSSICGQAPSTYPEIVEKLIKWGITSISVNPDVIDSVREKVYQTEKVLWHK